MIPVALTIAGSDPSGGAGLQADLKTFHQFGVYGCSAVTLLTVQNTVGVSAIQCLPAKMVQTQMEAVCGDLSPNAIKTGALGERVIIEIVAESLRALTIPVVVDPVMLSKHGHLLISEDAIQVLVEKLLPRALLLTPNALEAERLSGVRVQDQASMQQAAARIQEFGPKNVLLKGHKSADVACDLLLMEDGEARTFSTPIVPTKSTHGSGCVYSAAITALLARGVSLESAVEQAKDFIWRAIASSPGLGKGLGPVNMHVETDAD